MTLLEKSNKIKAKKFFLYVHEKEYGTYQEKKRKNQDLKLKISSEKIKYVLWSTSAVILILFLAKRIKMIK
jgi:hypothetical protein